VQLIYISTVLCCLGNAFVMLFATQVFVWETKKAAPLVTLQGHAGEVSAVAWCRRAIGKVASCSDDTTIRVWDLDQEMQRRDQTQDDKKQLLQSTTSYLAPPPLRPATAQEVRVATARQLDPAISTHASVSTPNSLDLESANCLLLLAAGSE